MWRLRRTIQTISPDVVLSFCDSINVHVLIANLGTAIPVVASERSDPARQRMSPTWERLRRIFYKRAAVVVTQTDAAAEYLIATTGCRCVVIPSAVEPPPAATIRNPDQVWGNRTVVAIGRFEREKGLDRLIDAFDKVLRTHPGWRLRIVGEGSLRAELQHQINELHRSDSMTLGHWQRDVWSELAHASLFVLPSRYEGFPSALLEAMSAGVPSIAPADCVGAAAIIRDGIDGVLAAADAGGLEAAIKSMIDNPNAAAALGKAAREVSGRFSWPQMIDAFEHQLRRATQTVPCHRGR